MAHLINFDEPPEQWIEIPKEWHDRTFDFMPIPVLSHPQQLGQSNVYDPRFAVSTRLSDSHAEQDALEE